MSKINDPKIQFNLMEDLKEHNLDGLGYSSSWARQFVEFYAKFSWLEGFAKINIVAMQKLLNKIEKILFDQAHSDFMKKMEEFIHGLELYADQECTNERKKIRDSVAKFYFEDHQLVAYEFLEASLSQYKHEEIIPLTFLCGMMVAL